MRDAAIECLAQMTRFIHRGDIEIIDAVKLSCDIAEAFEKEYSARQKARFTELLADTFDEEGHGSV